MTAVKSVVSGTFVRVVAATPLAASANVFADDHPDTAFARPPPMMNAEQRTSIYRNAGRSDRPATREAREARRARQQARLTNVMRHRPTLMMDRAAPILDLLRRYRADPGAVIEITPLQQYLIELRAEVEALEDWAESRPRGEQRDNGSIRQALDFLRRFGHLSTLDFSSIPEEERGDLVTLLALEHRWCYAAAGTTRDVFKVAIGRTGAR